MKKILPLFFVLLTACATGRTRKQSTSYSIISEKDEYNIGRLTAARILHKYHLYRNDRLTRYLTNMANYLALYSKRPYIYKGYHVGILRTQKPMAFSTPGGFIFVSRGLIKMLDTEDQLAAVIAHEIGHIERKHGLSYIKTAYLIDLSAKLAKRFGERKISDERKKKIAAIAVNIADVLLKRGYSRKQEEEADNEAVKILKRSGYNPYAIVEVLEKMANLQKKGTLQFTRTHPYPGKRAMYLKPKVRYKKPPEKRTKRFLAYKNML